MKRIITAALIFSLIAAGHAWAGITLSTGSGSAPLVSGSDADSTTTQSDSGLELVNGLLTLLRGCADNEILKWDETEDDWNCEADSTGAGSLGSNLSSSTNDILSNVAVTGAIVLGGTGNTNNEKLTLDFETTANTVAISSTTLVDTLDFNALDLTTTGTITGGTLVGALVADTIGTAELDDGADTPLTGEYIRVDTVDQAGIEYRTAAETRADIGADNASNLTSGTVAAARVGADHTDALSEIADAIQSATDANSGGIAMAASAGFNGNNECVERNANGALVTSGDPCVLTSGNVATSFFGSGTIEHERGGLEANVSAYGGLVGINAGATLDVDTETELETALGGLDVVTVTAGDITSANLATILSDETGTGGGFVRATSASLTTPTVTNLSLGASNSATTITVTNEGITGTSNNHLAKLSGAPSTVVISTAGDATGAVGIVVSGGGTTGTAEVAVIGTADCDFDGATTAGNYVQISASVNGECTDAGSSYPTTGQTIGRVIETIGAAGLASVALGGENVGVGAAGGLGTNLSSSTNDILSNNATGSIVLGGTGNTNNEKLTYDHETTANSINVSSSTGVTQIDYGSINILAGTFTATPSATPSLDLRDSNMGGTPDTNVQFVGNCPTGSTAVGDEDCDADIKVQAAGTLTTAIHIDTDTDGNITVDIQQPLTGTTGTFTGTLSGEVGVTLDTAAAVDLSTASNARGAMRVNSDNDVIDYTLPPAEAGLNICFYSQFAQVVTVDPDDGVDTITLDGTALTAGNAIDSAGGAGDFICLLALDATNWISLGRSGTWVDGGTD